MLYYLLLLLLLLLLLVVVVQWRQCHQAQLQTEMNLCENKKTHPVMRYRDMRPLKFTYLLLN